MSFVSGDVITRRHTVEMSQQYRDQLAKAIYGRLFFYLVNSINDYLQGPDDTIGYIYMYIYISEDNKSKGAGCLRITTSSCPLGEIENT